MMRRQSIKSIVVMLLLVGFVQMAEALPRDIYHFDDKAKASKFYQLITELRCLVCQNQNLIDSNAKLATDLKNIVYQQVLADKSSDAIKQYLTKRYGDYILFRPPLNRLTAVLWFMPFVIISLALGFLLRFIRRGD